MSVIVTGMNMPKCCHWDCVLCREDGGACILGTYDKTTDTKVERPKECSLKSVDGLIDDIYNMADDSIVFGHIIGLTSGRKGIEETVNAITDAYRKIIIPIIKKYCEVIT